jgi:ABC-2 type transport system permease protein
MLMIRLLSIEWIKLRRYRTFWVMLALHLAILLLIVWSLDFFVRNIVGNIGRSGASGVEKIFTIYEFPDIWQNITWIAVYLRIFVGVLVITSITNEFTYKTIRQNVMDGLSRTELWGAKVLQTIFFSLISTSFVVILCIILGFTHTTSKDYEYFFSKLIFIPAYFVQVWVYLSFCLLMAILVRRSGLAIMLVLLYSFVEQYFIGKLAAENMKEYVIYLPFNTPLNEINTPFKKYAMMGSVNLDFLDLLPALGYIGLFLGLVYFILQKRDL